MTVRIGVIGPGGMGRAHIDRITRELTGGSVVAVTDIDAANAARVAEPLGAKVHGSGGELIASDDVDAVLVTSFGPAHEESVLQAIEAGKPVLCEKPLAPTADACLRIIDAEVAAGRKLVTVGFMRRFDRSYNEMKQVLASGELGEALIVHNRHRNPTAPETYTATMAITDTAIHEIDTMRWLLDEEIVEVRVDKPKRTRNRFEHLQDPVVFIMRTESGVWIDDEVFVNIRYGYDIQCELVLEQGTVTLSDQNRTVRRDAQGSRNAVTRDHNDRFHEAFNAELQQWISAVARGEHTGSSAWDGYAAAVVCDAGVSSLLGDGEQVPVSLIDRPGLYA
ncbi:Gfo/Idh/MocA family protein [Promicromonospora panici]|uniref:Gfo/Idh/MocA family protein n=1 Tax=Promicromonospora panici TaxID=2219658 RepID=UPI00101D5F8C|nr:Gfo/Idh/MocA family oxidoreductase [Promicromonospora panici]